MQFKDLHLNVKTRLVETFFNLFLLNIIFIFMPLYFYSHFGGVLTGILLTINTIIMLSAQMYSGYYSDIVGRKKIMVFAEVGRFLSICTIFFANFIIYSPELTAVMISIMSLCYGLFAPAAQSMVLDSSKPEQRKYIFTMIYWIYNLSLALAGVIGSLLYKDYFFYLILLLITFSGTSLALVTVVIKESLKAREGKKRTKFLGEMKGIITGYKNVLKDSLFVVYLVGSVLFLGIDFQLVNYINIRLTEEMAATSLFTWIVDGFQMVGILRAEAALLVVVGAVLLMRLIKNISEKIVLYSGISLYIIGFAILMFTNNPYILIVFMFIATLGEMVASPIQETYIGDIAKEDARASYMATMGMGHSLAGLIGSLGIILGQYVSSYIMSGMILVMGFVIIGCMLYVNTKISVQSSQAKGIEA
jgi:DHA1 family multidrug resistance protein B-like MFS transporter